MSPQARARMRGGRALASVATIGLVPLLAGVAVPAVASPTTALPAAALPAVAGPADGTAPGVIAPATDMSRAAPRSDTTAADTRPDAMPASLLQGSGRAATVPATSLVSVTPAIAVPGKDVDVRIRVHNGTRGPVTPTITVRAGAPLTTREAVARHASRPEQDLQPIGSASGRTLAPGTSTTIAVRLTADRLRLPRPYGVLPLTVVTDGLPGAGPLATFLPYQVVKEYQPIRLAVGLPLTADARPAVLTGTLQERTAARAAMVETGSRLDRILRSADATDATLVADPSVLGVPAAPAGSTPTPSPTSTPRPVAGAADPLAAFGARVAATGNDVWLLPPGDPDVSALVAARRGVAGEPSTGPVSRPSAALPGRAGRVPFVTWPAGSSSDTVRDALTPADPAAVILRESQADTDAGRTGSAPRRDADGRRILVTDDRLSADLAEATTATAPAVAQRALADTVTLVAESPGRSRSFLLLPDRDIDPDPTALAAVVRTVQGAPWVSLGSATSVLGAAPTDEPVTDPTTIPDVPASPITVESLPALERTAAQAAGMQGSFGDALVPGDVGRVAASTRWRGHTREWTAAMSTLRARLDQLSGGVKIVPSTVNFFADHGVLQITVVNDLDVEVRNVYLSADVQGRPARLRVLGRPEPLTIRPHSRTTVRLDVEAVAAGLVPIRTSLRTAGGVPLGQDATVRVRVRPTNGWIVLAAGGVVGVIFLFGLFRAIRMGERRVAEADMRGLDLD